MIKIVASFLVGLAIGTAYPNEVRSIIKYALDYIGDTIKTMQDTLTTQEFPPNQRVDIDYNQLKIDNNDIVKELDPDWK